MCVSLGLERKRERREGCLCMGEIYFLKERNGSFLLKKCLTRKAKTCVKETPDSENSNCSNHFPLEQCGPQLGAIKFAKSWYSGVGCGHIGGEGV